MTPESFYAERDSRTATAGLNSPRAVVVAIMVPSSVAASRGGQLAAWWASSMLRRLGQAFSRTVIIADEEARRSPWLLASERAGTFIDNVNAEMQRADPFGSIEWRSPHEAPLAGIDACLWLGGTLETALSAHVRDHVRIDAAGWVASVAVSRDGTVPASRSLVSFDAWAPAAALAAAQGVAEICRFANAVSSSDPRYWVGLDSGAATSDDELGQQWFARGSSSAAPIRRDGRDSALDALVVVGAGGIGFNLVRILADSPLHCAETTLIDPDKIELSNLNRLCGASLSDVGSPKAAAAARPLVAAGFAVAAVVDTYERCDQELRRKHTRVGSAMFVGVDQAITRLEVAAEWPALLVNAGTVGTRWLVSVHRWSVKACLGCYFGAAKQPFGELRRGVACGAVGGAGAHGGDAQPAASVPFVSVAAAAFAAAALLQAAAPDRTDHSDSGEFREANAFHPVHGRVVARPKDPACRLLCGHPAVAPILAARSFGA